MTREHYNKHKAVLDHWAAGGAVQRRMVDHENAQWTDTWRDLFVGEDVDLNAMTTPSGNPVYRIKPTPRRRWIAIHPAICSNSEQAYDSKEACERRCAQLAFEIPSTALKDWKAVEFVEVERAGQ